MILRPLCTSPDLAAAITFGKARYESVAKGARPSVHAAPYVGATEQLLCRIILAVNPALDTLQIIKTRSPQEILVLVSEWSDPSDFVSVSQPFYDTIESTPAHTIRARRLGVTGEILAVGGRSGKPLVFTSTDTSVLSGVGADLTFAAFIELASTWSGSVIETSPNFIFEFTGGYRITVSPDMPITSFTVTLEDWGETSLYLSQDGAGIYPAAPTLHGGDFTFEVFSMGELLMEGGACLGGEMVIESSSPSLHVMEGGACLGGEMLTVYGLAFPMSGGACAGGSMPVASSYAFAMEGGVCLGGEIPIASGAEFAMTGGVCLGGEMSFSVGVSQQMTGGACLGGEMLVGVGVSFTMPGGACIGGEMAFEATGLEPPTIDIPISVIIPYEQRVDYMIPLTGTAKRGGVLIFTLTGQSANCTLLKVTQSGSTWVKFNTLATTFPAASWFTYKCTETVDGVPAVSLPSTANVQVAKSTLPLYLVSKSVNAPSRNGQIVVAGGATPYTGYFRTIVTGAFRSVPGFSVSVAGGNLNYTWTEATTDDGTFNFRVRDSANAYLEFTPASMGIPAGVAEPPPPEPTETWHWELQWTSPDGDIRNYAYFKSLMTLDKNGNFISPIGVAQLEYESLYPVGGWKIVGNYYTGTINSGAFYWCNLDNMLAYSPYRPAGYYWFAPPITFTQRDAYNNVVAGVRFGGFYVHKIYKWVYS